MARQKQPTTEVASSHSDPTRSGDARRGDPVAKRYGTSEITPRHPATTGTGTGTGKGEPAAQGANGELLVENGNGELSPGQMRKADFLSALRASVTAAAIEALGPAWTALECPYLERYLRHYANSTAAHLESAIFKYAPAARGATTARAYIPAITDRVTQSVQRWVTTQVLPTELVPITAAPMEQQPQTSTPTEVPARNDSAGTDWSNVSGSVEAGGSFWSKVRRKYHVRSAEEADAAISSHPLLREWIDGEKKAKGHTTFHSAAGFRQAHWQHVLGLAGGRLARGEVSRAALRKESDQEANGLAAFAIPSSKEIHVNRAKARPATVIHEALHLQQHSKFAALLGAKAMEGATDLFTLMICNKHGIPFHDAYSGPRRAMEVLKNVVGFRTFASTYFRGTDQLANTLRLKGKDTVKTYRGLLDQKKWREAADLLYGIKALAKKKEREEDEQEQEDAHNTKERARKDLDKQTENERKSWQKERTKAARTRLVRAVEVDRKKTRLEFAVGGRDGIRTGWVGALLDKRGSMIHGGKFVIATVTTGSCDAVVALPFAAVREASQRVQLSPPDQ